MEETGSARATHERTGNVTDNNELVTISRNARDRILQMKCCAFLRKLKGFTCSSGTEPHFLDFHFYHCQYAQVGQLAQANNKAD